MPTKATKPIKNKAVTPKLKATDVLTWLHAHPDFFEKHKEALGHLSVPKKGGNILSLHALKAEKIEKQAHHLQVRHRQLISAAQANMVVAQSVFTEVLALVACRTLPELRKHLQTGLADNLELQAVRLFTVGEEESATALTADTLADLCPQPIMLSPLDAGLHRPLFGPKTNNLKSVCLMALNSPAGTPLGLLALGSDDPARFHAGQSTELADFLRQVTGTVLSFAK